MTNETRTKYEEDESNGKFRLQTNIRVVSSMIVLEMTLMISVSAMIMRLTILNGVS